MGMFDSLLDESGHDWQTKAFDCVLLSLRIGDEMPENDYSLRTYQVAVLGNPDSSFVDSFATVRDGRLADVPVDRDDNLPLLDYFGGCVDTKKGR